MEKEYYGKGRTNYFKVKDVDLFLSEMDLYEVKVDEIEIGGQTLYSVIGDVQGGLPLATTDTDGRFEDGIAWEKILQKHIEDDWVGIIIEVGFQDVEVLYGYSRAFNNKGEVHTVRLDSIFDEAQQLGKNLNVL